MGRIASIVATMEALSRATDTAGRDRQLLWRGQHQIGRWLALRSWPNIRVLNVSEQNKSVDYYYSDTYKLISDFILLKTDTHTDAPRKIWRNVYVMSYYD